jgi:hypothetical protein
MPGIFALLATDNNAGLSQKRWVEGTSLGLANSDCELSRADRKNEIAL